MTKIQIETIVKLLLQVAHVDNEQTKEEIEVIKNFCNNENVIFDEIYKDFETVNLNGLFSEEEFVSMVLPLLIMVAYADGKFSENEINKIKEISHVAGISEEVVNNSIDYVRGVMISQISNLSDSQSVANVLKEL